MKTSEIIYCKVRFYQIKLAFNNEISLFFDLTAEKFQNKYHR